MRFNNRVSALLNIPDLPTGAFEKQSLTLRLYGGSVVEAPLREVNNVLDKADNWTEAVGDQLAEIDPGPAIGDAGEFIDKNVLQPMANDPIGTIATIAVIATGQVQFLPVVAAANTAIKGGKLEDIALSAAIAYAGSKFAPGINEWAGGGLTGAITTGAVLGAGGAGATAAVKGGDVGEAILRGGVVGGVMGGVGYGVSQGYNTIRSELGYGAGTPPAIQADAEMVAAQAEAARGVSGGVSDAYLEQILMQEGVAPMVATDTARLTNAGYGEAAVAQNIAGSYQPGEIYTPPPIRDNLLEREGKKLVTKAIGSSILDSIYGDPSQSPPQDSMSYLTFRRRGKTFDDSYLGGETESNVNLTQVVPDKFELRKYANSAGQSTLISFKDDQPQQPIPSGYEEVETIGAAEGGLISTNMVKYSKKPLMGPRKTVTKPKQEETTRKGLAVRKR